jgi:FkbM family methyltransferase
MKFEAYNFATRTFGWRVESEFNYLSRLAPVDLALDIGGNWGQSILAFDRTAAPRRTISFEPNPILAERLLRGYAGKDRIEIQSCALGDIAGEFELYVPRYRNFIFDGLASLDEGAAAHWLNKERMAGFDSAKLKVEKHVVKVRTLDSFNTSPDVVKIDVQGFELQVVKGGEMTFRRSRPITIVEAPTEELVHMFADMGMEAYGYAGGRLAAGETSGTNTIFIHSDRL